MLSLTARDRATARRRQAAARAGSPKASNVRSQLVRVSMDGASEVLAGSTDEAIFSLAVDDKGQVIVRKGS